MKPKSPLDSGPPSVHSGEDKTSTPRNRTPRNRAPRNRTLFIEEGEADLLMDHVITLRSQDGPVNLSGIFNKIIHQDLFSCLELLPPSCVDLLIIDPPYNLSKKYGKRNFGRKDKETYAEWFDSWFSQILKCLKPTATVYVCSDWKTSSIIEPIIAQYLHIRNRITWEREKGRGAKANWKNCSEDIWFCTVSDDYFFDVEAVKVKKKVIAPYRVNGAPKDWEETKKGNFRLTHPSNLWTDISIPFWSMPENTDHPTQKSEKLLAKLILASSRPGDFILDPFMGSGTTCVVANKLGRNYCGVEREEEYCQLAIKRLHKAEENDSIQGIFEGHFWERNTLQQQK